MLNNLINQIGQLKEVQRNMAYSNQQLVTAESRKRQRFDLQPQTLTGMYTALVVSTIDPLKKGRVRWYNPLLVERGTQMEGLPWASPVSAFGGFDDSGSIWVPPAGSSIVIFFLAGNRDCAHYLGTVWNEKRGEDGKHLEYWDGMPVEEYSILYDGKRGGYNFGDNSGSQVYPPWNTEMYNGYDTDSVDDFYANQADYASATTPYIYGMKTPQKHAMKHVDGDSNCNYRWRRSEWFTGCGNWILMKDDHLHPAGQWAFGSDDSLVYCRENQKLKEFAVCESEPEVSTESVLSSSGSSTSSLTTDSTQSTGEQASSEQSSSDPNSCSVVKKKSSKTLKREQVFANPFYKRKEEQRLYDGAPTPMNNKCTLPQSGIHIQSLSGNQIVLDDSVNQPKGIPNWEREFDFGCDNVYKGKMFMKSATGQYFGLHDDEDYPGNKSEDNGIFLKTANGISLTMNDHTTYAGDCDCPPNSAGEKRGLEIITSSTHTFVMNDKGLTQCAKKRTDEGEPKKHDKAGFEGYCMLKSGYGLQLLMSDSDRQDKTSSQFIEILSPQTDNKKRGPHMFTMQEAPEGPGVVMLRAGGVMYVSSFDDSVEVVGTEENEASKITSITGDCLHDTKGFYFNHSDSCLFFAENFIYLVAGTDDQNQEASTGDTEVSAAQGAPGTTAGKTKKASLTSVIVAKDPWVCPMFGYVHYGVLGSGSSSSSSTSSPQLDSRSKHVFASP